MLLLSQSIYYYVLKEMLFSLEYCMQWSYMLIEFYSDQATQKGYSSLLSFTVTDINSTVTKLMALGAELDGPIKHEVHGKVVIRSVPPILCFFIALILRTEEIRPDVIYLFFYKLM